MAMEKVSSKLFRLVFESFLLMLFLADIFIFKTYSLAALAVAYFIIDFIRYRREAVLNERKSKTLRETMTLQDIYAIEKKYSLRDDYNSFEKHAVVRPPLERYFYYAKYERLRELLHLYGKKEGLWLDFGCGFGEDTFYIAHNLSHRVIGLELDEIKLLEATKMLQSITGSTANVAFVAGDILHPPFRIGFFSTILMTEVLEHLIDPDRGAQNCYDLLKKGGIAIISVPSLHNIDYSLNPLRLLEKALSLIDDRVLPSYHNLYATREYNWRNPEPEYGIHYHFSHRQLKKLFEKNGFHVLWQGSFEIEAAPYLLLEFITGGDIDRIRHTVGPMERLLQKVPFVNRFGQHLLMVVQKRSS